MRTYRISLVVGMLVLLVGCGGTPRVAEQTSQVATVVAPTATTEVAAAPAATQGPLVTAAPPTQVPVETAAETSMPPAAGDVTTSVPSVGEVPASQTVPASDSGDAVQPSVYGLRRDSVWIATRQRVIGLSESQPEMPISTSLMGVRVSPDGSRVVYNAGDPGTPAARLIVQSTETEEVVELAVLEGGAINPVFSPDSNHVAYAHVNQMHGWQLKMVDLQTNEERVLQEGVFGQGGPTSVLVPQQWTAGGLIVSKVSWFGETNTSGLYQVDPATGGLGTIWEQSALTLTLSPDGRSVALVAGSLPMGGPGNITLSVVDIASGKTQVAREQLAGLWTPEWSPDSTKLAYVDSFFETGASILYVVNADGAAVGELRFGPDGQPGMLRDITWRDDGTLLLVVIDGGRAVVSEVPAGDLQQGIPSELAAFDAEMGPGTPHEVVHVP